MQYKRQCYLRQTAYALQTRGNDFAQVFGLCAAVEDGFRPACYRGLGANAGVQGIQQNGADVSEAESTRTLCVLSDDQEARSECVVGAAKTFIYYYHGGAQAKALCDSFDADLQAVCLRTVERFGGSDLE
jgi:hypothetical protein